MNAPPPPPVSELQAAPPSGATYSPLPARGLPTTASAPTTLTTTTTMAPWAFGTPGQLREESMSPMTQSSEY